MKLHLGCGQRYLDGYVNIDFPATEHSVQEKSVADQHADILALQYSSESVDEVRLHHVFEHFSRPVACALLAGWSSWLKKGGLLHIEVPDFHRTSRVILNPFASLKQKALAERHLFGSHEAPWAVHCEGYTPKLLRFMVETYEFRVSSLKVNHWRGTYNFEVFAEKTASGCSQPEFEIATRAFLANYLVDDSELKLLDIWMEMYRRQVEKSWASNG